MKKYIMMFLALVLTTAIAACGKSEEENKMESDADTPIETIKEKDVDEDIVRKESDEGREEKPFVLMHLDNFIVNYNNLASLTEELKPLSTVKPVDENNSQILLQEDTYAVLAIYDENDDVKFYSVGLTKQDAYEELKGNGLYATLNTGATLGLDVDKMAKEFESALSKEEHIYIDNGHAVQFDNHKVNGKSGMGMLVQIMKYNND